MALRDDLQEQASKIFREGWTERDGEVVPEPSGLELGNDSVNLEATVLYADMAGSTKLVDEQSPTLAAEVYKAYMVCAARIIKDEDGSITAYDGDRVMGVFIGNSKNTTATRTAMKIHWAVGNIINPALKKQYGNGAYQIGHVIGTDTSRILACRIGVRNDNDLVWVGRAANDHTTFVAITITSRAAVGCRTWRRTESEIAEQDLRWGRCRRPSPGDRN